MKNLLDRNIFLIGFVSVFICYVISFMSNNVVLNDKVYGKYLDEQYQEKYAEYKNLGVNLSEYEDELAQFDSSEDLSYGWDDFAILSLFTLVPMTVVLIGYCCTFLVFTVFHKDLQLIKFKAVVKCSFVAYPIFYLPEIFSGFYFLIFSTRYRFEDIEEFQNLFYLKNLFAENGEYQWAAQFLAETNFFYFIFPLAVALLLKLIYKTVARFELIANAYFAYLTVFVFYNTIFWYLFDLT